MAVTGKQERNGVPGPAGENSSVSMPGPMPGDVGGMMSASEAAAAQVMGEGHDLMASPQGSGAGGHQVGAHGDMFAWDAGLPINDVEGGGSG